MSKLQDKIINYGNSSIRTIIERNYRYIDKTEAIYRMITSLDCVFLSRPRRFGKTLLVDTLSEIFSGNKELFKDLLIYNKNYDWKSYPVIRLDMSTLSIISTEALETSLCKTLKGICKNLNIDPATLIDTDSSKTYLNSILQCIASTGEKAVVLIDEYDYPVINHLSEGTNAAQEFLNILREFYITLKANSSSIHFLLLTGVTRLAYTSIFSGLNNLKDISFNPDYCDIMGYTQKELEHYFSSEIEKGASTLKTSKEDFLSSVKDWYDGYRFSDSDMTVYNPGDVNQFFQDKCKFVSYWAQTGTSSFLVKLLSSSEKFDLKKEITSPKELDFFFTNLDLTELDSKENLVRLFYQTGYLTIKDYNSDTEQYYLDFPNREVSIAFSSYLVKSVWNKEYSYFSKYKKAGSCLAGGDILSFKKQ